MGAQVSATPRAHAPSVTTLFMNKSLRTCLCSVFIREIKIVRYLGKAYMYNTMIYSAVLEKDGMFDIGQS